MEPAVLATSGGHDVGSRRRVFFDALVHHAVEELSGSHTAGGCGSATSGAIGDAGPFAFRMAEAARVPAST